MTERDDPQVSIAQPSGNDELLPIREVVRLTGVNPVTLRAWERRYGLILPVRTEGGHRLYTQADVSSIRDIMAWTERGVAVSKVGSLLARRVSESGINGAEASLRTSESTSTQAQISEWQANIHKALQAFNEDRLDQLYGQVFSTYPLQMAFEDVLLPVWRALLSSDGFGQLSQWLLYDAFLRTRVVQRLQLLKRGAETGVLLAALPDQCRELELLVSALLLGADTTRISILPIGQPLEELAVVCQAIQPKALVLLAATPPTQALMRQLLKLAMSTDCPVALAGVGAELVEAQLLGSSIASLGAQTELMRNRLQQLVEGHLDT
jgi:DNA-binding transcriptional MerR regulator